MNSRRAFLKSIAPAAAVVMIATKAAPNDSGDICEELATMLAMEMEKRHGGRWVVAVDHENPSVFGRMFKPDASS